MPQHPDSTLSGFGGLLPQQPSGDGFEETLALLQQLIGANQAAPGPKLSPVPGTVSPLAQVGGAFASTLAEGLGARGAAGRFERQVTGAEQQAQAVEQRNVLLQQQDRRDRTKRNLDIQLQFARAKQAQAKQIGDAETELKAHERELILMDRQQKLDIEENKEKQKAIGLRQTELEELRQEGREDVLGIREELKRRFGDSPVTKALFKRFESEQDTITRKVDLMEKENEIDRRNFQPPRHTDEQLAIARAQEQVKLIKLANDLILKLEGTEPTLKSETKTTTVTKPSVNQFFKP